MIPADCPVVYAPTVLVALGISLVALAFLAEAARGFATEGGSRLQEGVSLLVLALVFCLWVFPGLRGEIQRFADRGLYAARTDYRDTRETLDRVLATPASPQELLQRLVSALRATFGPLHVQLWLSEAGSEDLIPVADPHLPRLGPGHPLRLALEARTEALVMTGEAARVADVPLHLACEVLGQRYGLRVFCPLKADGRMVGVLGCGPAGGRTFHPEDLDLLRGITRRLVPILVHRPGSRGAAIGGSPGAVGSGGSMALDSEASDPEKGALAMRVACADEGGLHPLGRMPRSGWSD